MKKLMTTVLFLIGALCVFAVPAMAEELQSAYTRTWIYGKYKQPENVSAAKFEAEKAEVLKSCVIKIDEKLTLYGTKISDETYEWSLTENEMVVSLEVITKAIETSNHTRTLLYDNWKQLENKDSVSFVSAVMQMHEDAGSKLFETKDVGVIAQIGIEEYGIVLHGDQLDENRFVWILTEKGNVICIELVTKK